MINHSPLPFTAEEQAAIRREFLSAVYAPEYSADPDWYDSFNIAHDSNIAVVGLEPLKSQDMPTLHGILDQLNRVSGLELSHFQMFVCRPRHAGMFHTDGVDRKASFNVPLFNCEVGGIDWTEDNPIGAYRFESEFTTNMRTEAKDLPVLDRMTLDSIKLLRVNTWHRINNLANDKHRVVFSLRFAGNPDFDTVLNAFNSDWRTK